MVQQAAESTGHTLNKAYERRMSRRGDQCRQDGVVFTPLPLETLSGWHESIISEVRKIASALSRQWRGKRENCKTLPSENIDTIDQR